MKTMNEFKVSMPYHGLSSFLQLFMLKEVVITLLVSMPYHGLSSFLPLLKQYTRIKPVCFNALPRAFFFSTWGIPGLITFKVNSFNALPRAFFFSTNEAKI